jgi:hypothetical protein
MGSWSARGGHPPLAGAEHAHLQGEGAVVADERDQLEHGGQAEGVGRRRPLVVGDVALQELQDKSDGGRLDGVREVGGTTRAQRVQLVVGEAGRAPEPLVRAPLVLAAPTSGDRQRGQLPGAVGQAGAVAQGGATSCSAAPTSGLSRNASKGGAKLPSLSTTDRPRGPPATASYSRLCAASRRSGGSRGTRARRGPPSPTSRATCDP